MAVGTLSLALLAVSFAPIFIRLSKTELGAHSTVLNRFFSVVVFGLGQFVVSRPAVESEEETPELKAVTITKRWMLWIGVSVISIARWFCGQFIGNTLRSRNVCFSIISRQFLRV